MGFSGAWFEARMREVLYNTRSDSGASAEYARGLVVGVMGTLLAGGKLYKDASKIIRKHLPDGYRKSTIPKEWKEIYE